MSAGIYKITNKINGKIYIGQSLNIEKRFNNHRNKSQNVHLKNAFDKYGLDNFLFEPIFVLDSSLTEEQMHFIMDEKEKEFIYFYESIDPEKGYNKKEGGSRGKLSEESIQKIKEKRAQQVIVHSEETKRKIGAGNKGKVHSLEQNLNHKNHTMTEEGRKRVSEAHKGKCFRKNFNNGWLGKHIPEDHKQKLREARLKYHKKILLVETQEVFNNAQEIEDIYRIKRKRIITSIAEKSKACGLTFTYNLDTICEKIISRDEVVCLLKESKSSALI